MARPYPQEFRDDVVRVARNRESGVTLEQIAGVLATTYPDRSEMQVSHETIYKALHVRGRGELRREVIASLRTRRALRKPRNRARGGTGRRPNSRHGQHL